VYGWYSDNSVFLEDPVCCPRGKSLSSMILEDQFSSPRPSSLSLKLDSLSSSSSLSLKSLTTTLSISLFFSPFWCLGGRTYSKRSAVFNTPPATVQSLSSPSVTTTAVGPWPPHWHRKRRQVSGQCLAVRTTRSCQRLPSPWLRYTLTKTTQPLFKQSLLVKLIKTSNIQGFREYLFWSGLSNNKWRD